MITPEERTMRALEAEWMNPWVVGQLTGPIISAIRGAEVDARAEGFLAGKKHTHEIQCKMQDEWEADIQAAYRRGLKEGLKEVKTLEDFWSRPGQERKLCMGMALTFTQATEALEEKIHALTEREDDATQAGG